MPGLASFYQIDPVHNSRLPDRLGSTVGTWNLLTSLFTILCQQAANGHQPVSAFKSVNGGIAWSLIDAAHQPPQDYAGANNNAPSTYGAVNIGNTIFVVTRESSNSVVVNIGGTNYLWRLGTTGLHSFDTTTELWSLLSSDPANPSMYTNYYADAAVYLAAASPTNFGVAHCGLPNVSPPDASHYDTVELSIYDTVGGWSTIVIASQANTQFLPCGICTDGTRYYVLYSKYAVVYPDITPATVQYRLATVSGGVIVSDIDLSGVLDLYQYNAPGGPAFLVKINVITGLPYAPFYSPYGNTGQMNCFGGDVFIPFADASRQPSVLVAPQADNPVFAKVVLDASPVDMGINPFRFGDTTSINTFLYAAGIWASWLGERQVGGDPSKISVSPLGVPQLILSQFTAEGNFTNASVFINSFDGHWGAVLGARVNSYADYMVTTESPGPPPPGDCVMYAIPIYLGPHNHVWKLGVANPGNPILLTPGIIIGTGAQIVIPTGFVDTSRITTPGVTPLQAILTVPQHTNFYASKWRVTTLDPIAITIERDPICNFESLVCRLNMQIPHSIIGNMPGEVI